jgi:hypothetical protein
MSDDDLRLPGLDVAVLDLATVEQLFFDIGAAGTLLGVQVKGGAEAHASDADGSLAAARDAFIERRAHGVQIRYVYAGEEWCDTLLAVGDGARLVRLRVADVGMTAEPEDLPL